MASEQVVVRDEHIEANNSNELVVVEKPGVAEEQPVAISPK